MIVRLATPADAPAVAALHVESWRSAYRGILSDEFLAGPIDADRRALWEARFSPDTSSERPYVAVAEDDGALQGFVCVLLDADPTWGALLDNLHVLPSAKGQGLGRRLMSEASRWILEQRPESRMHLWVFEENLSARRFYERLGGLINGAHIHESPDGSRAPAVRYGWQDLHRLAALGETIER